MLISLTKLCVAPNVLADFAIDTGCLRTGSLERRSYDLLLKKGRLTEYGSGRTAGLGGMRESRFGHLGVLIAGPFIHRDLLFGRHHISYVGLKYLASISTCAFQSRSRREKTADRKSCTEWFFPVAIT